MKFYKSRQKTIKSFRNVEVCRVFKFPYMNRRKNEDVFHRVLEYVTVKFRKNEYLCHIVKYINQYHLHQNIAQEQNRTRHEHLI